MTIRLAEKRDLEALVEIYNQAIVTGEKTADTSPYSVDDRLGWFNGHSPAKHPILVAVNDETVQGYLTISAHRPGRQALRHTAEVSFYIHFDYHRQGVASKLLNHAIKVCPELKVKTLFAILLETNLASIGLLQKFGFEKWGYLPRVAEINGIETGQFYYGRRV